MRFLFLAIFAFLISGCASHSHSLTYSRLINSLPQGERINGQMSPVVDHLYLQNMELYCGYDNRDSIALSETAKQAGAYMVAAYRAGQFCEPWQKKKRITLRKARK